MTTRQRTKAKNGRSKRRKDDAVAELSFGTEPFVPPVAPDASLHELFQRQTRAMLDRSDLDEEQKQSILVAMNCPCCGGSGLSFSMRLKRRR